jgi:hypothetical protein
MKTARFCAKTAKNDAKSMKNEQKRTKTVKITDTMARARGW